MAAGKREVDGNRSLPEGMRGETRLSGKKLLTIAEDRSLSNAELMDGLQPAFPAVSELQPKGNNGRFASTEC